MADDLEAIIEEFGDASERLLVLDFDGVLSPIVEHPDDAAMASGAEDALRSLLDTDLEVAVLSGRHVDDLLPRLHDLPVLAVGGHGSEARTPDGERTGLVDLSILERTIASARDRLEGLVGARDGWLIEQKPHSIAVHYRRVRDRDEVAELLPEVARVLDDHTDDEPGWSVLDGKEVIELRPNVVNKGDAIAWIASRFPGRRLIFIGDDVTDEEGFEELRSIGGDGILVNEEERETAARWRLHDPERVVELLERLATSL